MNEILGLSSDSKAYVHEGIQPAGQPWKDVRGVNNDWFHVLPLGSSDWWNLIISSIYGYLIQSLPESSYLKYFFLFF